MKNTVTSDELERICTQVKDVEGWLMRREIGFLATAAANPTAKGSIVELGSHKGKSTIVIAQAARHTSERHFATADPMLGDIRATFDRNLAEAGVIDEVEVHEMFSDRFIASWSRPIRFLFHDGSNTLEVVRQDMATLSPYFSDGAMIAFHDVLNVSGFRAEAFLEIVLNSDHFGPVGCCGSIGWGQYCLDESVGRQYRDQRDRLRRKLARLLPYLGRSHSHLDKITYKLARWRVPHRRVNFARWRRALS